MLSKIWQKNYVDGKPDYADVFEDNMIFRWDSQIGRGVDSSYVSDVVNTKRKHLLVKRVMLSQISTIWESSI